MRDLFNQFRQILISKHGVQESAFNEQFNLWSAKFGLSVQSKNDFIYSQLNQLVFSLGSRLNGLESYRELRPIYMRMWEFLLYEKKPRGHVFKQVLYCDLMLADSDNFKIRAHIIGNKCCTECDKMDGMDISLEEAILNQPLPVPGCTRETGCFCSYGFAVERDLNDRPIRKQ